MSNFGHYAFGSTSPFGTTHSSFGTTHSSFGGNQEGIITQATFGNSSTVHRELRSPQQLQTAQSAEESAGAILRPSGGCSTRPTRVTPDNHEVPGTRSFSADGRVVPGTRSFSADGRVVPGIRSSGSSVQELLEGLI